MTAPIDHDQFRHLLSEVKTQSTKDQRAYIRRFDTAIVDQLNPEERHRLFSLGRQSGGFYCHRQTLHWGETAIRANALALKLLGLQSDGERINTEALPDWASTDLLIRWCYRTKSPKLKSAGDKEQFAQSSLFILDWLRRNSTEPFINDFKQFVDTYKTGFCFPTHQCELFRQGLFQWGDLGDSILKEVCAPYHSWTPDSQKLTLSSSSPKARDAAQSALRYLPPISEIEFNRGWTGQEIFQLLSNLSSDRREGIVSLKIVDTLEIEREEFIAILDRLPRIKQLSILKSKMDEWPDLLELLKDHAPFIEKLSIDGACGRAIHEGLGWPKSGGIVYFACDSFYFCYDRVREALMKDRGYSLFLSLHPRLRNRIICEAFTGLSYTSNLSFEGLVRLRDACTETPPKAYKLLDKALDQLLSRQTVILTGNTLDDKAVRTVSSRLKGIRPKDLRLKGDWRDQGYLLSQHLLAANRVSALALESIKLDSPSLKALCCAVPGLSKLEIQFWTDSEESLVELLKQCKNLSTLKLSNCHTLCPDIYKTIEMHCPRLRELELQHCPALEAQSYWSALGLPSSCAAPISAVAKDPVSIHKLLLMILSRDPWIDAHRPLVHDLLAQLPTDLLCESFLSEPSIKKDRVAATHAFCSQLARLECERLEPVIRQRLSQSAPLELHAPLNDELLSWLSDAPRIEGTLVIHDLSPEDVPILFKHPIKCLRLDLPDTTLSPEHAEALLNCAYPFIQSKGMSFWHRPWKGLPEDLSAIHLLNAMKGEDGATYRLHVALYILTQASTKWWRQLDPNYQSLLQEHLDPEALMKAFKLMNRQQKFKAWGDIQTLEHIRENLVSPIRIRVGEAEFQAPSIALMGVSPRIEEEICAQGEGWTPNEGFSATSISDLIEFAEHRTLPESTDRTRELFLLASHYDVTELVQQCEQQLCDHLFDTADERTLAHLADDHPMPIYLARRALRLEAPKQKDASRWKRSWSDSSF